MAVTGSTRGGASRVSPSPQREARPQSGTRLTVVSKRRLVQAAQRRRARVMVVIAVAIIVGTTFVIGMGQNLLGTQQIRLDTLQQELASATQTNENLLLNRAQLEAPARILQLAEQRLGMVTPKNVIYLTPVTTGPTVADKGKESVGASR